MKVFYHISIVLLLCLALSDAVAQIPAVKTLRTYVEGNETSYPAIELDGPDRIVVEFDCIGDNIPDLEYSVVHCYSDGKPSDLQPSEYISGFESNSLTDYFPSMGTSVGYVNFRIALPNDNVQMLLSGRYMVNVFLAGHRDSIVAQTSFLVYEQLATITAEVVKPQTSVNERYAHDIRLTVDCSDLGVNDVFRELSLDVVQNGCPYASLTGLKPKYIVAGQLVYSYAGDMLMAGGNEFRRLDLRYLKQTAINYNMVEYIAPYFHVTTPTDEIRAFKPYFTETDQNGQYVIYAYSVNRNQDDFYRSADYAYVHPTLATDPVLDGDVFVCGAFNNWQLDSTNIMRYNFQAKRYESDLFLKQGVYDYMYVCRSYYDGKVDMERFEGSHSQTGNSYIFTLFYNPVAGDYERLVGVVWVDN